MGDSAILIIAEQSRSQAQDQSVILIPNRETVEVFGLVIRMDPALSSPSCIRRVEGIA
jgi:hypothetical protein